jgi:hypothetical protein
MALVSTTGISEVRVFPVYEALKKHEFVMTFRDRLVLLNRPDAPDQVDICAALAEYAFVGPDSFGVRAGGSESFVAAVEAFNQGFLFQPLNCFMLNGYNPQSFSVERAEIAGYTPANNRVIVKAPVSEADSKNKMGMYYLLGGTGGAVHFTGIQTYDIAPLSSWWDDTAYPHIDMDNLPLTGCGVFWPEKNWILWSVPMITTGSTPQTTNNRVIVYDLTLRAWLPPFNLALASLCTAYQRSTSAPGGLGRQRLIGGTYDGKVVQLLRSDATTDGGTTISSSAKTGWLSFGEPTVQKSLQRVWLYGKTSGSSITVKVYLDGEETTAAHTFTVTGLSGITATDVLGSDELVGAKELRAKFFKFEITTSGTSVIHGLDIMVGGISDNQRT